jgi:4-hydroxy-tetrahydrodipicolinate reductase
MRITLLGHGKTGKIVEKVASQKGDTIVHIVTSQNSTIDIGFQEEWIKNTDVLIDFSVAGAVLDNVRNAIQAKCPIVVGTTGWDSQLDEVRDLVEKGSGACVVSSNFSVGVQSLFYLARQASSLLSRLQEFHPFIVESHHCQKVDAPSGTALSLQEILEENYSSDIPVSSIRAGFFPGTHVVGFDSPVDTLTLEHTARSRQGFAAGAILAAEWIQGRQGFFDFEEVLFGEEND